MSDSDFDDDDDELLQLVQATQRPDAPANALYAAQGQIAILRAQLEALQKSRSEEVARLQQQIASAGSAAQEHIGALRQTVDKLEDEKKFLGNEIRALSVKRRRTDTGGPNGDIAAPTASIPPSTATLPGPRSENTSKPGIFTKPGAIQVQDDWAQFCAHIRRYTVNGDDRAVMDYLAVISVARSTGSPLSLAPKSPVSAAVWDFLLGLQNLRLDALVSRFCEALVAAVKELLGTNQNPANSSVENGQISSNGGSPGLHDSVPPAVPFLVCLLHAAVSYKRSAVQPELVLLLVAEMGALSARFVSVLADSDDDTLLGHNCTAQQRLLDNFTLLSSFDVLESVVVAATQLGPQLVARLWTQQIDIQLVKQILPENTERFISAAQINLVYNLVEMLSGSVVGDRFAPSEQWASSLVKSLLKVFLIEIPVKEDFRFFGLNRAVGNNGDLARLGSAFPRSAQDLLNNTLITLPHPVKTADLDDHEQFRAQLRHEEHLLCLRNRIVSLLEALVMADQLELLNQKDNIKSIVRIMGFEQNYIMHQPRHESVPLRLAVFATFMRLLSYVVEEHKNINTLIFPETLYELFVILMRVAFASDSFAADAQSLLSKIRNKGVTDVAVFNRWCELRSRELAHVNLYDSRSGKFQELAEAESGFANGLEFAYDAETVEIAREILSVCVNHDEADNLYYNMRDS